MSAHQDAAAIFREAGDQYNEAVARANLDEALAAGRPEDANLLDETPSG